MRLRWGPHRGRSPEQVVLRDPAYVLDVLDRDAAGALASRFRDLIDAFDSRPLTLPCVGCGRAASSIHAYPASTTLIGVCSRCTLSTPGAPAPGSAWIDGYEGALRHVASSFRQGLTINMRRIIDQLARAKGGPQVATQAASSAFLHRRVSTAACATPTFDASNAGSRARLRSDS